LVFFITALFVLQSKLALISLVVIPLFWLAARYFTNRIKTASRERQRVSGSTSSVVEQNLSNIPLVQAYDQGGWEVARFRRQVERKYRTEMASARLRAFYTPTIDLIELAGLLTVIGCRARHPEPAERCLAPDPADRLTVVQLSESLGTLVGEPHRGPTHEDRFVEAQ